MAKKAEQPDIIKQPVSEIQLDQLKIEWVPREKVVPNKYNPNRMTWHDRMLLRQSLLEDGWTQPIVCLPNYTIIDGEQRWTVASLEIKPSEIEEIIQKMEKRKLDGYPESDSILFRLGESKKRLEAAIEQGLPATLAGITGGLVPVTILDLGDDAHKIIATIRHNRARGTHQIDAMAGLARDLVQLKLDLDDLESRLGMDDEEINRFLNLANEATSILNQSGTEFSQAWAPVHFSEKMGEDAQFAALVQASEDANQAIEAHQHALADRSRIIDAEYRKLIKNKEKEAGRPLRQDEKDEIKKGLEKAIDRPAAPPPPQLVKLLFFVTIEEAALIDQVLGSASRAKNLVTLCRQKIAEGKKRGRKNSPVS